MDIPELFNIIFNHLTIRDKRSLLLTCKTYYAKSLILLRSTSNSPRGLHDLPLIISLLFKR